MPVPRKVKSTQPARIQKIKAVLGSGEMSHASIVLGTGLRPGVVTKTLRALVKDKVIALRVEPHPNHQSSKRAFYRLAQETPSATI